MHNPTLMLNIILLALLWGPSFLFIKISVQEISPITLVAFRIGLSALLLLAILKFKKIALPRDLKLWKHCFFMGIIATSIPFILYGYSLGRIDSSLSALINSTTPMSTLILANIFLTDEKFTLNRSLGVVLGLLGFLVLCLPSLFQEGRQAGDLMGMLFSFAAATCYAIGMIYARKNIQPQKEPLVLPTLQFVTSMIYLIPAALLFDPPIDLMTISFKTQFSIAGLALLGTVFAFIVYYRTLMRFGATALSTVTYLLPLLGALFGVVFGNEVLSLNFCIAAALILLGTLVANNVIALPMLKILKKNSSTSTILKANDF